MNSTTLLAAYLSKIAPYRGKSCAQEKTNSNIPYYTNNSDGNTK